MTKTTFKLLEIVLRLNDKQKKNCIQHLERAKDELEKEISRLKGNQNGQTTTAD